MHLFPESIFEVRTKKCKKTVKRNRTTGKCQPFTTRNVLHFHARKKKTKDWFYHLRSHFAWIWTLTGAFYSEHSFCCFTDYTKLYVCAHRASKTLTARLEAGPALVVSQVSRVGSQQGRTRFHSLLTPESQHQEPICSHKTCICPNSRVLSAGLRSKGSVLCVQVCISFTQLSQPLSKEGWHWLHAGGAWRAGAKGNCDNWLLPCWKLKGLTDRTSSGYLWFKGHIMLPLRFVNLQGIDEVGQGHTTQSTPLLISVL